MVEGVKDVGVALDGATNRWFGRAVDLVVRLLVPLAIVALMMGIARVFLDLWSVWRSPEVVLAAVVVAGVAVMVLHWS